MTAVTGQALSYRLCKVLVWSVRVRDGKGRDLTGVSVERALVRVVTKTLRDGAIVETFTSQALTRLSATKVRQRYGRPRTATQGELLDEAVQELYGPALKAIVRTWRKGGEVTTDLPDEAAYPLALKALARDETARRGQRVSRARLIAEAIHAKWGAELEALAPELYGAPYFTGDEAE